MLLRDAIQGILWSEEDLRVVASYPGSPTHEEMSLGMRLILGLHPCYLIPPEHQLFLNPHSHCMINGLVSTINGLVSTINGLVSTINGLVSTINGSLSTIVTDTEFGCWRHEVELQGLISRYFDNRICTKLIVTNQFLLEHG